MYLQLIVLWPGVYTEGEATVAVASKRGYEGRQELRVLREPDLMEAAVGVELAKDLCTCYLTNCMIYRGQQVALAFYCEVQLRKVNADSDLLRVRFGHDNDRCAPVRQFGDWMDDSELFKSVELDLDLVHQGEGTPSWVGDGEWFCRLLKDIE